MKTTNFCLFEGQLFRYEERVAAGKVVSAITVRVPSSVKGKDSTFVNVEAWALSESLRKDLSVKSGTARVVVKGELRQDSWKDKKTGDKRTKIYLSSNLICISGEWNTEEENNNEKLENNTVKVTKADDDIPF